MRIIIRSVLIGSAAATIGTLPWAWLVKMNLNYLPTVPWSVPAMAVVLYLLWNYTPRTNRRANPLSADVWMSSIFAGMMGLFALVMFLGVFNRLVALPQQQAGDLSPFPFWSLAPIIVMSAIVAGLVEESAFRGYMQSPIEERYGPVVAILITGTLFGLVHFSHPETTLALMPFYLAVATIYGMLAYLTKSIWPGAVLHAVGNIFGAIDYFARGQSEWQTPATPLPLVWQSGPDAAFWFSCVAFLVVGTIAVWAYRMLAVQGEIFE
jgi:membrane protease YdiL (CAAX protease family)